MISDYLLCVRVVLGGSAVLVLRCAYGSYCLTVISFGGRSVMFIQ